MTLTQKNDLTKYCRVCGCELTLGDTWLASYKNHNMYICRKCNSKRSAKWAIANPERVITTDRKYKRSHIDELKKAKYEWVNANRDQFNETKRKWSKTKKGKIVKNRAQAKRRHNLGWELLFDNPFPDNVLIEYHHISDGFVVAIPTDIHKDHYGKNHREELKPIIESIYNITYVIENLC